MAESNAQEKTEDATPKRRLDARKKGTVARSPDLTSAVVLVMLLLAFPLVLTLLGRGFTLGLTLGLGHLPPDLSMANLSQYVWRVTQPCLGGLAVVILIAMVIGTASTTAQVGLVLSAEGLAPSFAKLNPLTGFKRLFSSSAVFEAGKALAKSVLFGSIAYLAIASSWGKLVGLGWLTPQASVVQMGELARGMAIKVVFAWLAIAGIDYVFQRKRIDKQLRMSKEEVKQEMKQMEQSAELKGEMARKRRRMARGRMMEALKTADVVVTNPTHYAVAIKYDPAKSLAPEVVAKGADLLAAKIREVAKAHEIPIVPNPPLARALFRQCEIGDTVPKELFQPMAEVLAYVYQTIRKVRLS